jgi:RNA polymerase sigma-70 factor (ECF subfamily)
MDEQKDLQAVGRCLRGDTDAFEELILRYQKPVMNLAYRIVHDLEDARDVAQSVFVKAFSGLSSYDSRYKFFSWLYRIAINESLNYADKRNRRTNPADVWGSAPSDPLEETVHAEQRRKIEAALEQLAPRQRVLLALSADGLSYKEIGRTLGCSEIKVKSKLFAARHKLRGILTADGGVRP